MLPDKTSFAGTNKVKDIFYLGAHGNLILHALQKIIETTCILQDDTIGLMDVIDEFAAESTTAESHHIQSAIGCRITCNKAKRKDILAETRATSHHTITTHTAELVHEYTCAEDSLVVDNGLTSQLGAVADDALAAHNGIMSHVHALHEQIVAAHHCLSLGCRTAVDGDILAYLVVVPYLGRGVLTPELEVLRNGTDDSSREEDVAIADTRSVEYGHAVHQRIVITNDHAPVNVAEGTYLTILAYPCLGMDVGQRTNLAHNNIIYIMCI